MRRQGAANCVYKRALDFKPSLWARPDGGTGRRSRLKIFRRKSCGFDSHSGHQIEFLRTSSGRRGLQVTDRNRLDAGSNESRWKGDEKRVVSENFRIDDNTWRPHLRLGYRSPVNYKPALRLFRLRSASCSLRWDCVNPTHPITHNSRLD